jgi:dTDP-D-glucose 4,6-dehydratase
VSTDEVYGNIPSWDETAWLAPGSPHAAAKALYGDGRNVRGRVHVDDHCRGIHLMLDRLDDTRLSGLGYAPWIPLGQGPADTVRWYADNRDGWEPLKRGGRQE